MEKIYSVLISVKRLANSGTHYSYEMFNLLPFLMQASEKRGKFAEESNNLNMIRNFKIKRKLLLI